MPTYDVELPVRMAIEADSPERAAAAAANLLDELLCDECSKRTFDEVSDELGITEMSFGNGDAIATERG